MGIIIVVVGPAFVPDSIVRIIVITLIFAALAEAWDLPGGYGRQIAVGHAGFIGLGAFTSAILFNEYKISPWIGLFVGGGVAAAVAIPLGFSALRLRGFFFAMGTFAFNIILLYTFTSLYPFGFYFLAPPSFYNFSFTSSLYLYYIVLAFAIVAMLVSYKFSNSRFGYFLKALGNDEVTAEALGVNVFKYKLLAFMISAFLAGLIGTIYAEYLVFINAQTVFDIFLSINLILIAVVGGSGRVFGPILGSLVLIPIRQATSLYLSGISNGLDFLVYGLLVIIFVLRFPKGIISFVDYVTSRKMLGARGRGGSTQ